MSKISSKWRVTPSRSATFAVWERSWLDQRTCAEVGEELEQYGVWRPAVDDHDALDAAVDGGNARLDLGDHAAADRAVGDQRARLADAHFLDQLTLPVEDAR